MEATIGRAIKEIMNKTHRRADKALREECAKVTGKILIFPLLLVRPRNRHMIVFFHFLIFTICSLNESPSKSQEKRKRESVETRRRLGRHVLEHL